MYIVVITACTTGIAHTYITKKKLIQAAESRGHHCRIETQGTIGVEDELTPQEIADADVVILAVDVKIHGEERFKGKPVIRITTETVMQNALGLIQKVESLIQKNRR